MAKHNWKRVNPRSASQATELCLVKARECKNLSVERVGDLMGLGSHWSVYKWVESGRLPLALIRPFEAACGADFISRFVAHSGGNLLVPIPRGRKTEARDVEALQTLLAEVIRHLLDYRDGRASVDSTLAVLVEGMEALGRRYGEISREQQPELDFGE